MGVKGRGGSRAKDQCYQILLPGDMETERCPTDLSVELLETVLLVSWSCCNKLPRTWCLKTIHIYFLKVLEARGLKWVSLGSSQGISGLRPLEALKGKSLGLGVGSCFLQFLEAADVPWLVVKLIALISASTFTLLFLLLCQIFLCLALTRTHAMTSRVHLDNPG